MIGPRLWYRYVRYHISSWNLSLTPEILDINDKVVISLDRVGSVIKPHTDTIIAKLKFRFFTAHEECKLFSEMRQEMVSSEESHSWTLSDLQLNKLLRPKLQVYLKDISFSISEKQYNFRMNWWFVSD